LATPDLAAFLGVSRDAPSKKLLRLQKNSIIINEAETERQNPR